MISIVDCNNFFASAERVFNPMIRSPRPVIVLSNNDGCVVARSAEAKSLGIKMGVPAFEIKELITKNNVAVFSSNYALYGDMSSRVMRIISEIVPEIETYSIDEAFLDLSSYPSDQHQILGNRIRETIQQWIGIPVSVGIAPTKVLAKVASKIAKKKTGVGVVKLSDHQEIAEALSNFPVEDLWGIGGEYAKRLHSMRIFTALQFRELPLGWIQKNMTVNGLRIALELQGRPCIPLEFFKADRKAIGSAKGFGKPVTTLDELKEALSTYTSNCAAKMRLQKNAATTLSVFLQTNFFNKKEKQYSNFRSVSLARPTSLTPILLKYANHALEEIFRPDYRFQRVGILLTGFVPENTPQADLFDKKDYSKMEQLQAVVDKINLQYSRDQVRFACQGFSSSWKMKQEKLSPRYTTRIDEIITVKV